MLFATDRPARVRVAVELLRPGRKFAGVCVPAELSPDGGRCTLAYLVRDTRRDVGAWAKLLVANVITIKPRGLPVGVHRVKLTATDRLGPGVRKRSFVLRIVVRR